MTTLKTEKVAGRERNRGLKDYSGQRFGRLVAVQLVARAEQHGDHRWAFRCDCGEEVTVGIKQARSGHTRSCGCLFRETLAKRNETHGLSRKQPREYRTWKDMRSRCTSENHKDYAIYGGRGIKVCERWDDFALFFSDMGIRPDGMTIDRVDTNGNYEPGNCRWATSETQANNKRTNMRIAIGGEERTLQQWCRHFGIDRTKVSYRLSKGYSIEQAFQSEDFRK